MAQHWDDFTGTPLPNYTEGDSASHGAPSVITEATAPGGKALRISSTGSSGGFPIYSILRNDLAAQSDWEAACQWRYLASGAVARNVLYIAADRSGSSRGYYFDISVAGARSLFRQTSFSTAPVGATMGATVAGSVPARDGSTKYGARMRRVGADVKAKHWAWDQNDPPGTPSVSVGTPTQTTAPISGSAFVPTDYGEPAGWTVERTDGTPLGTGVVGVGAEFQPSGDPTRVFDYGFLSITDAPGSESATLHDPATNAHKQSRFLVKKVSDNSTVYDSEAIAATTGPHTATGLPPGTALYAQVLYQDRGNDVWSAAGNSSNFTTLGVPATPTVAVTEIRRTTVKATPSAYSHPDGLAHAVRRARVRRVSDSTIEVASHSVALSGAFYLTGLPEGPSGAGGRPTVDPDLVVEVQDEDSGGQLSAWGASADFQTLNLWESGEFVTHLDVQIEREASGGGTEMQSYRGFGGRNWIRSLKLEPAGVDRPIGSGVLVLVRETGGDSLAPLMTLSDLNRVDGSFSPALDFGREVLVRACILPVGTEPEESDWIPIFGGVTDDISWPKKTGDVSVPFRDYTGKLADAIIRDETRYGDPDTPPDFLVVMQQVVDDWMGSGEYTIWDQTTGPGFAVTQATYVDISVWEALQNLAQVAGGKRVEQRWNPVAEEWQLAVLDPDRTKSVPDYAIGPQTYLDVQELATRGVDLRTIVRGECVDRETGALLRSQLPEDADIPTDPLIALYGPRTLIFREPSDSSPVDSQAELDDMVEAIYADVSRVPYPMEPEAKFAPFAAVDDLVTLEANGRLFDEGQDVAVLTLTHDFPSAGVGRTRFTCSDKPKGAIAAWLRRGVEIAGRNARPSIFDLILTQDGTGSATELVLVVDPNAQVERWEAFSRVGASPLDAGIPGEGTSRGAFKRVETLTARWPVRDGVHHVLVRGYAGDDQRVFAEREETITISGVGGGGTPGTDAPADVPATPHVFSDGAIIGSTREVNAEWINTNDTLTIEYEWLVNGLALGVQTPYAAGSTTVGGGPFAIGARVAIRVRYTQGAGFEGDWATSPATRVTDLL